MKITAIEIGKIAIPLKTPFITALRRVDVAEDVVVKVHTDTDTLATAMRRQRSSSPATATNR